LLLDKREKNQIADVKFAEINDLIKISSGATLPENLISSLKLDEFYWRWVTQPNSRRLILPMLFLGFNQEEQLTLDNALATIQLERRLDGPTDTPVVRSIRVSGLTHDSSGLQRAVGISFNPNTLRVYRFDVSVSHEEMPRPGANTDAAGDYGRVTNPIPTNIRKPYYTAGFITEEMVYITQHERVLQMNDSNQDGYQMKMADHGHLTDGLGFALVQREHSYQLVYKDPASNKEWSIRIPNSLRLE
jgi:hypothetical protein